MYASPFPTIWNSFLPRPSTKMSQMSHKAPWLTAEPHSSPTCAEPLVSTAPRTREVYSPQHPPWPFCSLALVMTPGAPRLLFCCYCYCCCSWWGACSQECKEPRRAPLKTQQPCAKRPQRLLGQRTKEKRPGGLLVVFFPNLANTVAEVGKAKPYGSGWEAPQAVRAGSGTLRRRRRHRHRLRGSAQHTYTGPGRSSLRQPARGRPLPFRASRASPRREARRPPAFRAVPPSTPFPGGVVRPGRKRPPGHKQHARPVRTLVRRTAMAGVFALREATGGGGKAGGRPGRGRRSVDPAGPEGRGPGPSEPAGAGGKRFAPGTYSLGEREAAGWSLCRAPTRAWGWGIITFLNDNHFKYRNLNIRITEAGFPGCSIPARLRPRISFLPWTAWRGFSQRTRIKSRKGRKDKSWALSRGVKGGMERSRPAGC